MSDAAIAHFLETVYPDAEDGWLVLSYPDTTVLKPDGTPVLKSDWLDVARSPWQRMAQIAARRAKKYSVYFGVALQHPACKPETYKRGSSVTAYLVPGLWFDLDLAYGQHAASTLPQTDREALQFLADLPARPSLIIHSGGGMYGWWLFKEPYVITSEAERETIAHLSRQFTYTLVEAGKERKWTLDALGDLARVLRPPGTVNHKYGKLVELIHEGHERYNPSDFADWLLPLPQPARTQHNGTALAGQPDLVVIAEHYGTTLERKSSTELAGAHPQHGSSTGSNFNVNLSKGLWHCWRHGTGGDALALIAVCEGLLDCDRAVSGALRGDLFRRVVDVANEKFQAGIALEAPCWTPPPALPWPTCDPAAYWGLVGDIVRLIEPQTESDPIAILVQLLTMVGNAIGRTPYFPVEADEHYTNIFVCLVGDTAKGRKGTAAGHARRIVQTVDRAWKARVMGGLSSGEGVIWHVRDAVYGQNKKGEEVCLDAGVDDKRLCILESEFARGLAKTGQEGNVLSAVLRQAWDHGDLNTLVSGRQKAPVKATNAHVSVIAHITMEELQRLLTDTEKANGFGNRFLWVCVRRSKLLPRGGRYPEQDLRPLLTDLTSAVFYARTVAQMRRTPAAEIRWESIYAALADAYPGLFGAIIARAEAQVLRLACLYALLDKRDTVDVPHLEAAYALWRYCEDSARYLFGTILGDPVADEIYRLLQLMAPDGMTRTAISDSLGRHISSDRLHVALTRLVKEGIARYTVEKTPGRPAQKFFLCAGAPCELSELSPAGASDDLTLNSLNSQSRRDVQNFHSEDTPANFSAPIMSPLNGVTADGMPSSTLLPDVGDLVYPLAADGSRIPDNGIPYPYLITAIEEGSDGQRYARFMESPTGWPIEQCQKWSAEP